MDIPLTTPVQGMQRAMDTHTARATRLAKAAEMESVEKDLAELPTDPENLSAQTKAIKAKDQMLGDLLDILA